jgi:proteasome lid subunit RPN8/RPN11
MQAHAERSYPNECCGLIVGRVKEGTKCLVDLYPVENTWDAQVAAELADDPTISSQQRYWIAPEAMLFAMRQARSQNLEIIGIYHSHPDHPAMPSEYDRRLAWQHYSYIILSVMQGKAKECYSWQLGDDHQFYPEAIAIGDYPAPLNP